AEVSVRCARKWVGRYRVEGELGLMDRPSTPGLIPHRTSEERVAAIASLRRLRFTGPEIAETLGMALSTVSGILTRIGMGKLGRLGLEPAPTSPSMCLVSEGPSLEMWPWRAGVLPDWRTRGSRPR